MITVLLTLQQYRLTEGKGFKETVPNNYINKPKSFCKDRIIVYFANQITSKTTNIDLHDNMGCHVINLIFVKQYRRILLYIRNNSVRGDTAS